MKKLNFACGSDIKKGWDNCDIQSNKDIIYCNANLFPYPFDDNTYDFIVLRQCLYIFDDPRKCLEEIHRISKNKAIIHIEFPHAGNIGTYNEISSKHHYTEKTFFHFVNNTNRNFKKKIFKIIRLDPRPTWISQFFPKSLRKNLSYFIMGMYNNVIVKLEVIK